MTRCATCRWWSQPHGGEYCNDPAFDAWGSCELAGMDKYVGQSWKRNPDPLGRQHPQSKAVAHDCENYAAGLSTAPDFGCVQWEGKA